ncbi:MAG: PaaI family thioesterase [Deltaproteobacteria bacterium]|nr:MAG: PaaI family thioesterase [Deltaproteobacteria bacterium]
MSLLKTVGEEVFLKRAQEITASQPLYSWLGARVAEVSEGFCELQLGLRDEFFNDRNTLQAKVIFALLDAATFVASRTLARDRNEVDFHQEIKLNFISAVREVNQTIIAKGRALHRGRSTAVVEGEVYDQSGKLVAKALGTIAILKPPPANSHSTVFK